MAFSWVINSLVSEGVLFIFQLPAMTVLRYLRFIFFSPFITTWMQLHHVNILIECFFQFPNRGRQAGERGRCMHRPLQNARKKPYLSCRQAMPGSSRPSRNSREAPPPVEMWVILSAKPSCSQAAAL